MEASVGRLALGVECGGLVLARVCSELSGAHVPRCESRERSKSLSAIGGRVSRTENAEHARVEFARIPFVQVPGDAVEVGRASARDSRPDRQGAPGAHDSQGRRYGWIVRTDSRERAVGLPGESWRFRRRDDGVVAIKLSTEPDWFAAQAAASSKDFEFVFRGLAGN